jgi:hypothetical protein
MVGLSGAGETAMLNGLMTGGVYVSLHTADPGTSGTNELSGNGYARQSVSWTTSGSIPTVDSNTSIITFPTATGNWGTVTHFGLWTASSGGTFLGGQALTTSRSVLTNDIARFLASALQVSVT